MSDEMQTQDQEAARTKAPRKPKAMSKLALNKNTLRALSSKEACLPIQSGPNCLNSIDQICWP